MRDFSALAAGCLVALCGLAPTSALAAPTWLAPDDLSTAGQSAEAPQVAVDPAGDAVAVWARSNGSHTIIQGVSRPAGGAWGAPMDLSAAGRNATEPQVAVDAAGNAVAVWARSNGSHTIIQGVSRPAGGAWGAPMDLSAAGRNATEPQVAVDPAGNAVAVWARFDGAKYIVQSAAKTASGVWGSPDDLSAAGQSAEAPQVAVDPAGNAVAVWARFDGAHAIVQSAGRTASGVWGSPDDLSAAGQSAEAPQVAVDPAGNAVAVWARANDGVNLTVQSSAKPAGGTWAPTDDLSQAGQSAESPQVAVDPAGNAVAVWKSTDGGPTVVRSASKPAGGAWLPSVGLSEFGLDAAEPQLALDPAGDGAAVWSRENAANTIVQAGGYDAAGPRLGPPVLPTAGTIRRPVSFAVSPFDAWSPLGPIGWSFGDGGGAAGAVVKHTYRRPGRYPVTVVVADAVGNVSTVGGTIAIYKRPSAARFARVRRGRALLRLRCPSPAGCRGSLRLIAGVQLKRHRREIRRRRSIGRRSFRIRGKRTSTVRVRLTAKGKKALRRAGKRGLRTQLSGPSVTHRVVTLLSARKKNSRRNRRHWRASP